ncbi:hypothetical protein HYY75_09035 [bacterium]|nr:hypothetical protein [bacterium]
MKKGLLVFLALFLALGFYGNFVSIPLFAEEESAAKPDEGTTDETAAPTENSGGETEVTPDSGDTETPADVFACPKCNKEFQAAGQCEDCKVDLVLKGETGGDTGGDTDTPPADDTEKTDKPADEHPSGDDSSKTE